jgi:Flp pilus assembly protein TadG
VQTKSSGVAILEFLISLPLLIILVVGIVDIGSFFYQMELASDAVRYGAREAARRSFGNSSNLDCPTIEDIAREKITTYMTNTLKISRHNWELVDNTPRICSLQGAGMNQAINLVQVRVSIQQTALGTCLFCYLGMFSSTRPILVVNELLPQTCNGTVSSC